jgi:hypothetical protein
VRISDHIVPIGSSIQMRYKLCQYWQYTLSWSRIQWGLIALIAVITIAIYFLFRQNVRKGSLTALRLTLYIYMYMASTQCFIYYFYPCIIHQSFEILSYSNVKTLRFRMSERFDSFSEGWWCYMWNQTTVREVTSCGKSNFLKNNLAL